MKTFQEYLAENADVMNLVKNYLTAGEILNPEYEDLKYQVGRAIRKESDAIFTKHVAGTGGALAKLDPNLDELSYGMPENGTGILALKNKLAKVKSAEGKEHGLYKDVEALYHKWLDTVNAMKELKGKVVKVTQKRAEAKTAAEVAKTKKFSNASSLVGVLMTHKDEFVNKSKESAKVFYSRHFEALRKANNDLDVIAPSPSWKLGRTEYQIQAQKRQFYSTLINTGLPGMIEQAGQAAEQDFMAWVHKMIEKIGKSVIEADMTGNPWHGSTLHVTCIDGEKQSWNTQMIINQSKYQKLFNQFPSRRIS